MSHPWAVMAPTLNQRKFFTFQMFSTSLDSGSQGFGFSHSLGDNLRQNYHSKLKQGLNQYLATINMVTELAKLKVQM